MLGLEKNIYELKSSLDFLNIDFINLGLKFQISVKFASIF